MAAIFPHYFDHINGAPPIDEAVTAMVPWLGAPANPQMDHQSGRRAQMALEAARAQVAGMLNVPPATLAFTASGTEANNLGIKGFLNANRRRGDHILLSAVEHLSVARAVKRMSEQGYRVDTVPVDRTGRVDPRQVAERLTDDTALVCIQLANPEVGAIQPVADIAALCKPHRAALLVDAVAAAGRMPIDATALGADLLTLAAAPMGGPAGAAALHVRKGLRIQPLIDGGVQENGWRGGLENVAAAVGFGVAAEHTTTRLADRIAHLDRLATRLRTLLGPLPGIHFTGPEQPRLAGHVSMLIDQVEGQSLLGLLDKAGVAASSGSLCGAKAMKASEVLTAMGYGPERALSGVVFSFGPGNSLQEVDQGAELLRQCIDQCHRARAGA